jgi:VanZ family protein
MHQTELTQSRYLPAFLRQAAILIPANPAIRILFAAIGVCFFITHMDLTGTILDYQNIPVQFQLLDKFYHLGSYGLLTFLVLHSFMKPLEHWTKAERIATAKRMVLMSLFVLAYGIFDEVSQPFVGRRFEVLDLFANCFGIASGQLTFVFVEAVGIRDKLLKKR